MTTTDDIIEEVRLLLQEKQADYGTEVDPLAASRAMELFGLPAWFGQLARMQEKMIRPQGMIQRMLVGNSPDVDLMDQVFRDIAGLAVVALVNLRGSNHAVPADNWIACSTCGERYQYGRPGSIASGRGNWCGYGCHREAERS